MNFVLQRVNKKAAVILSSSVAERFLVDGLMGFFTPLIPRYFLH
jgi:hypothetical protein